MSLDASRIAKQVNDTMLLSRENLCAVSSPNSYASQERIVVEVNDIGHRFFFFFFAFAPNNLCLQLYTRK